ncbi:hypothetical protein J1N35_030125 [Gossypium stocksii]|uniref:Uncharacterized protein n=1 Tax=Gossypium stocksii TaxID=47602 RepID=A0A9D3ZTL2_9ROSI|nr:hypothetical protein J1N35_030125 [Gossypium stocksii]
MHSATGTHEYNQDANHMRKKKQNDNPTIKMFDKALRSHSYIWSSTVLTNWFSLREFINHHLCNKKINRIIDRKNREREQGKWRRELSTGTRKDRETEGEEEEEEEEEELNNR